MGRPKQKMFAPPDLLPTSLRACFLVVDVGFILYWILAAIFQLPQGWFLKGSNHPLMLDWTWTFCVLDLLIAVSGLWSLYLASRRSYRALPLAMLSLAFSFCAGLQSLSFGTLYSDFSWLWWLPTVFLLFYPLPFMFYLIRRGGR